MILILAQFVLSALTVIFAGVVLTRSADRIAEVTGIGGLIIGGVLLAAATSLPELTVDISAIRQNMPDLALGDLFGSSLANLFILALADLVHQSKERIFSQAGKRHALAATQSIALTGLAGIGLLLGPKWDYFALGGTSYGSFLIVAAYLVGLRVVYKDQKNSPESYDENKIKFILRRDFSKLTRPVGGFLTAAIILLIAAPYLAAAAGELAEATGLGKSFIGLTLVAICTSLPEVVSTFSALRMGAFDLALGNIFGSNSFNMLLILPLDLAYQGPLLMSVSPSLLMACLGITVVTAVTVIGQLYHLERRRFFVEPDALLVMLLIVGVMGGVYLLR